MGRADSISTKCFKLSDGTTGINRFEALPDDVLCRILSFLPTKLSVSTSILAKRWRFLWAHVPVLNFQYLTDSSNFVNTVMMRHKAQHIHTFRISHIRCGKNELEAWIITLTDRNVQKVDLSSSNCDWLPPCLFTWKTLVDLTLYHCGTIHVNDITVCLPALKKLCLDCVEYESDDALPHLLSGCPVLEELTIYTKDRDNMMCCYISSPTLTKFFMVYNGGLEDKAYKVKLDTPALRYLWLRGCVSEILSAGALTSLTEAHVDLYSPMTLANARSLLEFISRMFNVEDLFLSTGDMEVPDSEFCALTTKFHNLVKLVGKTDWRLITKLLENADNLQDLKICMHEHDDTDLKGWMDPKQVPACLVSRLGAVCLYNCDFSEDEFYLVRYILRNAKVLKLMEIKTHRIEYKRRIDLKQKKEARERISLFERGSDACRIHVH